MRPGFFPTKVEFRGSFRFANADDLERALAAIQELIDGEEDDLASELELWRKQCELRIRVDTTCVRDEYLAYETLIETLGTFAIAGEVTGEIDDTITTYAAGASAADFGTPNVAARAASVVVWIPVIAMDSILDLAAVLP